MSQVSRIYASVLVLIMAVPAVAQSQDEAIVHFEKAAKLWEELKLPVRLRRFRSGLLVVQRSDWTDEKVISQLKIWLQELHNSPSASAGVDWVHFGHGVTAQEAARRFGWSVGVAGEELEMAEERGVLCREEGIEGLKFWENHLIVDSTH